MFTSNGRDLPLYDDPDAEQNHDQHSQSYYIEATTGAPFAVTTRLSRPFKIAENQVVRVSIRFDGSKTTFFSDIENAKRKLGTAKASITIGHLKSLDPSTKQWFKGELSFGRLAVSK